MTRYVVEHPPDNNIYGTQLREDNIDVTKGISACDASTEIKNNRKKKPYYSLLTIIFMVFN